MNKSFSFWFRTKSHSYFQSIQRTVLAFIVTTVFFIFGGLSVYADLVVYYPTVTWNNIMGCWRQQIWSYENGYEIRLEGSNADDTRFIGRTSLYYSGQLIESRDTVLQAGGSAPWTRDPNCYRTFMISYISPMSDSGSITVHYNYWSGFGWSYDIMPSTFIINKKKRVSDISVSGDVFGYGVHFLNTVKLFDATLSSTSPVSTYAAYDYNWNGVNASYGETYFYGEKWFSSSCNVVGVREGTDSFFVDYDCSLQYNQWYGMVNGWPFMYTRNTQGTYEYPKSQYSFCDYDAKFCQLGEKPINKHPETSFVKDLSVFSQVIETLFCKEDIPILSSLSDCKTKMKKAITLSKDVIKNKQDIQNSVDPVNIETGEFTYENTLLQTKDTQSPYVLSVNYRSQVNYDWVMGFNWSHNYDIYLTENTDGSVTYTNGILNSSTFTPVDSSWTTFHHLNGINADLVKSDSGYIINFTKGIIYTFGVNKHIQSMRDINGNVLIFTYDTSNKLISVMDSLGRTVQYTYTGSNRISRVTDFAGRYVSFEYYGYDEDWGSLCDLKSITIYGLWGSSKKISFTYDKSGENNVSSHNLKDLIDAKGQIYVTNTYDTDNRILSQKYGDGTGIYKYSLADIHADDTALITGTGKVIGQYIAKNRVTDRNGNITEYTFNQMGNILSRASINKKGDIYGVTTYVYNQLGQVLEERFPSGRGTSWKYNTAGNIIEKRQKADMNMPDNNTDIVDSWTYDTGSSLPITYIDPNGNRRETTYNSAGLILSETLKDYHGSQEGVGNNRTTQYIYDNLWRRTQIINPLLTKAFYSYSGSSSLITSVQYGDEPTVRTESFIYNNLGNIISKKDALGNVITYEYDAFGNGYHEQSASGTSRYTIYDNNNNLYANKIVTGSGWIGTQYEYDSLDQIIWVLEDESTGVMEFPGMPWMIRIKNRRTNITYDANGNIASKIYANGAKIAYARDEFDRVVSTTQYGSGATSNSNPTGITTSYTYDLNGNILTQTSPTGFVIKYEYDGYNRPIKIYDSLDSYLVVDYDKNGNKTDEKRYSLNSNILLSQTHTTYNELNQILTQTSYFINKDGSIDGDKTITLSYVYDNIGNPVSVARNGKIITTNSYNNFGEVVSTKDALENETQYIYDALGQKIQEVTLSASGIIQNTLKYTYNLDNQLIATTQVSADSLRTVSKEYNALGQITLSTDALGKKTSYTYDFLGKLLSTQYPDGTLTSNEYDSVGKIISTTDEKGNKTTYEYDIFGNLSKKILPDSTFDTYEYNQLGNIIKSADANGTIKTYTYDILGRLTDAILVQAGSGVLSAPNTHRTYDALGHIISITNSDGSQPLTFSYDGLGQLTQESQNNKSVSYTYNSDGLLDSLIYPSTRTIKHNYDTADKLTSITNDSAQPLASYTYNGNFLTSKNLNGIQQQYQYDGYGRNTQIISNTINTPIIENYGYDNNDNLITNNNKTYTYDTRDQLTSESESGATLNTYTYDTTGNILAYTWANTSGTYALNNLNQYTQKTTSNQTENYIYAPNGDLNQNDKYRFIYNTNNQLVEVWKKAYTTTEQATSTGTIQTCTGATESGSGSETESGTTTSTGTLCTTAEVTQTGTTQVAHGESLLAKYKYDALGRRYEKDLGTGEIYIYFYSGQDIVEEQKISNNTIDTKEYIYGQGEMDDLEAIVQNNQIYTTLKDRQGSIRRVIDTNGNTIQSIDYDAYGNILSETGSNLITNRLYTGREYDKETNLYYLRARYYNSQDHRFLQRDPLGNVDSLNQYLYTKNNPLRWTDRSGKMIKQLLSNNVGYAGVLSVGWALANKSDLKVSSHMLGKFLYWNNNPEYYDNNSFVAQKVKQTSFYKNLKLESKKSLNKLQYQNLVPIYENIQGSITDDSFLWNMDFGLSFWTVDYSATLYKDENGSAALNLDIKDEYRFYYRYQNKDLILNPFNIMAKMLQDNWYGHTFNWELNITDSVK